jgi:phosphatidylserine synthase
MNESVRIFILMSIYKLADFNASTEKYEKSFAGKE